MISSDGGGNTAMGDLPFYEDEGQIKTEADSIDHFDGQVYVFRN